jgi:lysophospholipase L1-like esterase
MVSAPDAGMTGLSSQRRAKLAHVTSTTTAPAPVGLAPWFRLGAMLLTAGLGLCCAGSPTAPSATRPGSIVAGSSGGGSVDLPAPNALGGTRFLAFGDSITFGVESSFDGEEFPIMAAPGDDYPAQLDGQLEAQFTAQDFVVDNFGLGGETAATAVSSGRFAQALASRRPQGVLILQGINDLNQGRSIGDTVNALSQMVSIAQLYEATALIATMYQTCVSIEPGSGRVRENSYTQIGAFNSAVRAMAANQQDVYLVDVAAAFGTNCGPEGGVGLIGNDGLHPTVSGFTRLATTFGSTIRTVFAVRGSYQ